MDHASTLPSPRRKPIPHASADRAERSIGQAAAESGVSAKMIRYYESVGLIGPATRSAANYRSYDAAAIQTLRFVARARRLGFSLNEVTRLLALWREPGRSSGEVKALALTHMAELDSRIAALHGMRSAIAALTADCCGDERPDCPILDELSGDIGAGARHEGRHAHD